MKSGNRSFLILCAIMADENNSCGAKPRNGNLSIGTWRMGGGDKDETNKAGNLGHRDTDSHVFCPTAARLGCSNILARKSERDPMHMYNIVVFNKWRRWDGRRWRVV